MSDNDTQAVVQETPQEDTVTEQTSEASVQTNTEAPEAAQETKEPVVGATDTAEDRLYAGKYKSVEDLEKSYQELNSKFTNTSQEKAELAKILNQAFETPESPETATDDYAESTDDPRIQKLEIKTAIQDLIINDRNADIVKINEILNSDPLVKEISSIEGKLKYAHSQSKNMDTQKAIADAKQEATQATQSKIVEKQTAQVEPAKSATQTDENSELMERATGNYSQNDRDAARLALIRKNLVNL